MTEEQFQAKMLEFKKETTNRLDRVETTVDGVAASLQKLRTELTGVVDEDFPALRIAN